MLVYAFPTKVKTSFRIFSENDLRIEGSKSIFLCRNIEKGLAPPILKTASLIGECTIIRQSTTSNNLGVIGRIKRKRRCRPQHAKYVELLEVSNRTVEKKQKVKHLKAKRLQEFIESNKLKKMEKAEKIIKSTKVEKPIENAETTGDNSTRTAIVKQPIEYQKFNLENFDISNLNSGILNDKPLICFNNETHIRRIIQNPIEIQKILIKNALKAKKSLEKRKINIIKLSIELDCFLEKLIKEDEEDEEIEEVDVENMDVLSRLQNLQQLVKNSITAMQAAFLKKTSQSNAAKSCNSILKKINFDLENVRPTNTEKQEEYCYCNNKGRIGLWVQCENQECPYSWFHGKCAGFETEADVPTTWYCERCTYYYED